MNRKYPASLTLSLLIIITNWFISCSGRPGKENVSGPVSGNKAPAAEPVKLIRITGPEENAELKLNQSFDVELEAVSKNRTPDSVLIYFDSRKIVTLRSEPWICTVPAGEVIATGRKSIRALAYRNGVAGNPVARLLIVYSDMVPPVKRFRVHNSYPHDIHAFTQGLFIDRGLLYESTGQETESSLREVELKTGRVLRQMNLDASLFGEGITLHNDRIFQVTWRNKVGFVYDRETFRLINKIFYPSEGWGLTTIGDRIAMSDGTNTISFYEPEMFTIISKIEVYDNEKKVDNLNELEFIGGEIWANIWMEDRIARIDPVTGKVNSYIDLTGLFPVNERNPEAEVLNGIACDPATGKIYVTGKRWSKMFEISVIE